MHGDQAERTEMRLRAEFDKKGAKERRSTSPLPLPRCRFRCPLSLPPPPVRCPFRCPLTVLSHIYIYRFSPRFRRDRPSREEPSGEKSLPPAWQLRSAAPPAARTPPHCNGSSRHDTQQRHDVHGLSASWDPNRSCELTDRACTRARQWVTDERERLREELVSVKRELAEKGTHVAKLAGDLAVKQEEIMHTKIQQEQLRDQTTPAPAGRAPGRLKPAGVASSGDGHGAGRTSSAASARAPEPTSSQASATKETMQPCPIGLLDLISLVVLRQASTRGPMMSEDLLRAANAGPPTNG